MYIKSKYNKLEHTVTIIPIICLILFLIFYMMTNSYPNFAKIAVFFIATIFIINIIFSIYLTIKKRVRISMLLTVFTISFIMFVIGAIPFFSLCCGRKSGPSEETKQMAKCRENCVARWSDQYPNGQDYKQCDSQCIAEWQKY